MDETLRRFGAALPEGLDRFARDLRRNVHAAIGAAARRAELVTREDFEVQTAVLNRTRARLDALEARIATLEEAIARNSGAAGTRGSGDPPSD